MRISTPKTWLEGCRREEAISGLLERHGEKRLHERTLHTILGEVTVERVGYAATGQASVHPLDEQLQLPQRCFSYPLQERLVRHAVQGPFDEAVANVERETGVRLSKRSAGSNRNGPKRYWPSSGALTSIFYKF